MTAPMRPRPRPPAMQPLPRWQWVAGIVAAIVLVALLIA